MTPSDTVLFINWTIKKVYHQLKSMTLGGQNYYGKKVGNAFKWQTGKGII